MKRVVRSLLLFFCTTLFMLSASVCVCVVCVYADTTGTYSEYDAYTCIKVQNQMTSYRTYDFNNDGRMVIVNNRGTYYLCFVFDTFTQYRNVSGNSNVSCPAGSFNSISTVDGYYTINSLIVSDYLSNFPDVPIVDVINNNVEGTSIYYTYGGGAVDPVEPVNWGLVDVEGYQTNIAGQGQAAIHNVDVITWDSGIDTNGNDITYGNVRIRFIPGEYRSSSKENLFSQTSNDFILDIQNATTGNVFPVTAGSASFKWSDVIDTLNMSSISIFNTIHDNDMWLKRGWIYEIRLEIDDYIGEWQPIYASTSSGVENDLTIVNTSVITQNTITAIQLINSLNNTSNIWIVNGQPVDPNPEQTPPEDENKKPWWVYLLEMINNTLGIQNEYINEGTDESIEVVNNFEDDHTELNTTVNDYDDIENDLVLDMNNNIEQIEIDSDLIENNSFLSSARWVADQYTTIVTDNPIGSILKFSLVLGFVMIFLGRFK